MKKIDRAIFCMALVLAVLVLSAPPAMSQSANPILLKFSHQNPPSSPMHKVPIESFLATVEKKSNNRIKTEYYPSEMLVKSKGDLQGVRTGVADIQITVTSYNPDATPLSNLYMLPFAHTSAAASFDSFMKQKEKYIMPEINKLGDVKLLSCYMGSNYTMFSADKPIHKMTDLKGLRVRSPGSVMSKVLAKIGAIPMTMASADQYEALQKRTLDVVAHTTGFLANTSKIYEATKTGYLIDSGGLGTFVCLVLANKNKWNTLPADLQKMVEEEAIKMGHDISIGYDNEDAKGMKVFAEHGVKFISWDAAEKEAVKKIIMDLWVSEGKRLDAKGFAATELLNEFRAGR